MPAPKRNPTPPPAAEVVHSIKGFDQDLACRGYQFAIGRTYTHTGPVETCRSGFHACDGEQHPLSVFEFYPPAGSRYCEVTQSGTLSRQAGCSKIASATITIGVEITIGELVKRAWDWVWERATKSDDAHVTIDQGAASATGYQGAASSTGGYGAASSTGDYGAASSTGYKGAAMSSGYEGRVLGADGNALFAVERDENFKIVSVAAGIVGENGIKPNVWYAAKGGKLAEVA